MGVSSEESVVKGCRTMETARVSYQRGRETSSDSFHIIVTCFPSPFPSPQRILFRGTRHMASSVEDVNNRNKDTYSGNSDGWTLRPPYLAEANILAGMKTP